MLIKKVDNLSNQDARTLAKQWIEDIQLRAVVVGGVMQHVSQRLGQLGQELTDNLQRLQSYLTAGVFCEGDLQQLMSDFYFVEALFTRIDTVLREEEGQRGKGDILNG